MTNKATMTKTRAANKPPKADARRKENQPIAEDIIKEWLVKTAMSVPQLAKEMHRAHGITERTARNKIYAICDYTNIRTVKNEKGDRLIIIEDARRILRGVV